MSEIQKKLDLIEEETKCSICTGLFHDPHLLNCGHCFCGSCIIHWFAQKKCCPKCREPAIRQPIQVITLQKICDALRPANAIVDRKLTRADWESLYPVENQSTFIRDVDQDGIIHRCSNCGWELDEENYCGQCRIHYDNASVVNDESDYMHSDAGSHLEQEEEDLEDFVVDNDQVEYEHLQDSFLDDNSELPPIELSSSNSSSNDEEEVVQHARRNNRKRRRVINDSDEEGFDQAIMIADDDGRNSIVIESEDEDEPIQRLSTVYLDEDEDEDEESEVEYADDPFDRPRNPYIDDYASEDEDEEVEPKPVKEDRFTESIKKAQENMSTQSTIRQTVSSSSEDSSDDEPADYNL